MSDLWKAVREAPKGKTRQRTGIDLIPTKKDLDNVIHSLEIDNQLMYSKEDKSVVLV
jgi:hypothetical protein